MLREDQYFQTLSDEELWQRYCGYLDLSIYEFMEIQEHLLTEQINLVANSLLGRKIMKGRKPKTSEEFRQLVPLTTYEDYEPYLSERQEDALAVKPFFWCHSAGRGGKFKWLPYTSEAFDMATRVFIGYMILTAARSRGEINIRPGGRLLIHTAARPYASGTFLYHLNQVFSLRCMPPHVEAEKMTFQERVMWGFQLALRDGADEIFSISSVLVNVGERMANQAQGLTLSRSMLHPQVFSRLIRGWWRSKTEKRAMLPKDIWRAKGLLVGGTDTAIYKDDVAYYWGQMPYEVYGATEAINIAAQNWTKKWLSLIPYTAFWEFIPEKESLKSWEDKSYEPSTVLLNELEEGKLYEVVLTQLYGMPLLRYRLGDIIRVVAIRDDEAGVNLPQIIFHTKVGETIDLASLARLTEKVIWQAISNTKVKYEDWSARKEYEQNKAFLRIYIELKEERDSGEIGRAIHEQLKIVDVDYQDIESWLELRPVRVTSLSKGTFQRYYQQKVKEGADLAHLKPPHINASNEVINQLLEFSGQS